MVGWVGRGGGECLARRLAHRLDRAAAGRARHELAELVKVDCEGAGVSEKKDHRWFGGQVVRWRGVLTGAVVVQIELRYEIGHLVIGHLVSK